MTGNLDSRTQNPGNHSLPCRRPSLSSRVRNWPRMAPVVPDPRTIKAFKSEAAFDAWMRAKPLARDRNLVARVSRKNRQTERHQCAGAGRGSLLGLYRPDPQGTGRRVFSAALFAAAVAEPVEDQVNREHVGRLGPGAGRMQPAGQRQVDAAKADGRSAPPRQPSPTISPRQSRPIRVRRRRSARLAVRTFFAITFRTNNMKRHARNRVTRGDASTRRDDNS